MKTHRGWVLFAVPLAGFLLGVFIAVRFHPVGWLHDIGREDLCSWLHENVLDDGLIER